MRLSRQQIRVKRYAILRSRMSQLDAYWMQHCLTLARQGRTSPNPQVGSVIVKNGQRVGSGFHPQAGEPHAEVFALRAAGAEAQGATLYVNLEPCHHQGRTPPCTQAILAAGIQRVVAGMEDPNPLVAGRGIQALRAAGLEVTVGVEESACRRLNEAFCFAITHQRSFGLLKYAMTLDGKIATRTGHSQWVSGSHSRQQVHQLRSEVDAVVIGGATLRADDPRLTARLPEGSLAPHQPLRVVLSRHLDLPDTAQLWDQTDAPTVVITGTEGSLAFQQMLEARGIEVLRLEALDPLRVAQTLYQRGVLSVLWECGGTLAAVALQSRAIQKVWAFIAPQITGGILAPGPVGGAGVALMSDSLRLEQIRWQPLGEDIWLEGYLPE